MEYEYKKGSNRPHNLKFENEEAEAVRAAYVERAVQELREDIHRPTSLEEELADDIPDDPLTLNTASLKSVINKLDGFAKATDSEVLKILRMFKPDYLKNEALRRKALGAVAGELATGIMEIMDPEKEFVAEKVIKEFRMELDQGIPEADR
jgi:hypothetical protein